LESRAKVAATCMSDNPYKTILKNVVEDVDYAVLAAQFQRIYGLELDQVEQSLSDYPWHEVNWVAEGGPLERILEIDGVFGDESKEDPRQWDFI